MTDASTLFPLELERTSRRHRPPRLRDATLRRERLLRRLAQTTHVPLALIVAPAGHGKTTLLSHWLQDDARPVAWLAVDEADGDPDSLIRSIAFALDVLAPADLTLAELVYAIEGREDAFVLVLDDLHHVR
jgi:ATP/maltotriose-dependent transcriptional regulator MalT